MKNGASAEPARHNKVYRNAGNRRIHRHAGAQDARGAARRAYRERSRNPAATRRQDGEDQGFPARQGAAECRQAALRLAGSPGSPVRHHGSELPGCGAAGESQSRGAAADRTGHGEWRHLCLHRDVRGAARGETERARKDLRDRPGGRDQRLRLRGHDRQPSAPESRVGRSGSRLRRGRQGHRRFRGQAERRNVPGRHWQRGARRPWRRPDAPRFRESAVWRQSRR